MVRDGLYRSTKTPEPLFSIEPDTEQPIVPILVGYSRIPIRVGKVSVSIVSRRLLADVPGSATDLIADFSSVRNFLTLA